MFLTQDNDVKHVNDKSEAFHAEYHMNSIASKASTQRAGWTG